MQLFFRTSVAKAQSKSTKPWSECSSAGVEKDRAPHLLPELLPGPPALCDSVQARGSSGPMWAPDVGSPHSSAGRAAQ